jgi:hypothetical protein
LLFEQSLTRIADLAHNFGHRINYSQWQSEKDVNTSEGEGAEIVGPVERCVALQELIGFTSVAIENVDNFGLGNEY